MNEYQHIKSIRARQRQSIALLKHNAFIDLVGTLMWNKVADLYGYFGLFANGLNFDRSDGWKDLPWPDDGSSFNDPEDLYKAQSQVRPLPWDLARIPYQLLCPLALLCIAPGGGISNFFGILSHNFRPLAQDSQRLSKMAIAVPELVSLMSGETGCARNNIQRRNLLRENDPIFAKIRARQRQRQNRCRNRRRIQSQTWPSSDRSHHPWS